MILVTWKAGVRHLESSGTRRYDFSKACFHVSHKKSLELKELLTLSPWLNIFLDIFPYMLTFPITKLKKKFFSKYLFCMLFKIKAFFTFRAVLVRFTTTLRRRYRDFPYVSCPHICLPLFITSPHQSGAFATIEKPTLTHGKHPKSIVYIRVPT